MDVKQMAAARKNAIQAGECHMAPGCSAKSRSESLPAVASIVEGCDLKKGKDLTMFANNAALGHVLEKRILRPTRIFNRNLPPYNEHYSVVWTEGREGGPQYTTTA